MKWLANNKLGRTRKDMLVAYFERTTPGLEEQKKNTLINLIFMDPCIVDYSVEIPTRCRFEIEFIISKFTEGSTCFERHTAHHQEL
jgi:hypothetical protein